MNARSRLGSLAIAAALVAGQLAPAGHDLLVRHVVCAEHGERTHASSTGAGASDEELAPLASDALTAARDASRADEHEHCRTVVLRGRGVRTHAEVAVRRAPPATATPFERDPAPPSIAILRLAPKSSPPIG